MDSIFFLGGMCLIWGFSLFNGTGLGEAYHTNTIAFVLAVAITLFIVLFSRHRKLIPQQDLISYFGMTSVFVFSSAFNGFGLVSIQYLWCFLMVYILSKVPVEEKALKLTGIVFAGLGAAILLIFDYGTALSGWNPNSIAMIGLFSYFIFVAGHFNLKSRRARIIIVLVTAVFFWLIWPANSRSCMIMLIVAMLVALFMLPNPRALRSKGFLILLLLFPLILALFVSIISYLGITDGLNRWSLETFQKSLFNGRDTVWIDGFKTAAQHFLIGTGEIKAGVWHNSAVACLASYGPIGYFFWARSLLAILKKGAPYLEDPVVTGCMMAFILMNIQQSTELGMFAANPNLLIYLPLGLLLGRIRWLKKEAQPSLEA